MAQYLTYSSLTQDLLKYLNRSDDQMLEMLPTFIMLAERRISRDLKILGLLKIVEGVLLNGNPYLPKPSSRWLKTNSFFVNYNKRNQSGFNTRKALFNRDQTYCQQYWPDFTQTGIPVYYSDFEYGDSLIVPVPAENYPYYMSFYEVPVLIDENNSTNFLTDYNPDILIAGCLVEGFNYLKNFAWAAEWERKYKEAIMSIQNQNVQLMSDSNSARGT